MRVIDGASVHRLLDYALLVEALAAAHREAPPLIGRSLLIPPAGAGRPGEGFLVLPAWAHGRAFGVKMVTILPGNALLAAGPPSVQATYQLFEGRTGQPVAVLDGTALTLRKTAADSGLGAKLLAREDVRNLLMIGAGALAPHLIAAHRAVRPSLERVLVWNRSAPRRDRLLADLAARGVPAESADDLEAAIREADVISAATMATEPLVRGAWLKPGTHVDLVGAYQPRLAGRGDVREPRQLCGIVAIDIDAEDPGYLSRLAPGLLKSFREQNVLLRPIGNTVYVMPPYCITQTDLDAVFAAIWNALAADDAK